MNDLTLIGSLVHALGGKCRVCGCGGDSCRLEAGEKCCWIDQFRSLCSNPKCVTADAYRRKRDRRNRARAVQQRKRGMA